jgi:hypothetical protein
MGAQRLWRAMLSFPVNPAALIRFRQAVAKGGVRDGAFCL